MDPDKTEEGIAFVKHLGGKNYCVELKYPFDVGGSFWGGNGGKESAEKRVLEIENFFRSKLRENDDVWKARMAQAEAYIAALIEAGDDAKAMKADGIPVTYLREAVKNAKEAVKEAACRHVGAKGEGSDWSCVASTLRSLDVSKIGEERGGAMTDDNDVRPNCPICFKRDKLSRPNSEVSVYNCNRCGTDFDKNGMPTPI